MKSNLFRILIPAIILGLLGGVAGSLLSGSYILKDHYRIPFPEQRNFNYLGSGKNNIVIEGAEEVTVEQNERVAEVTRDVRKTLVGIFERKKTGIDGADTSSLNFEKIVDEDLFYNRAAAKGEGMIMTEDGWILAYNFAGPELSEKEIAAEHIIVTEDKKIREIEKAVKSRDGSFIFLKLKESKDLPVAELPDGGDIQIGDMVLAVHPRERILVTNIVEKTEQEQLIKNSEDLNGELLLAHDLNTYFPRGVFLFDLKGRLVGVKSEEEKVISTERIHPVITSLLKNKEISRSWLGVNYIELSRLVVPEGYSSEGALLYGKGDEEAVLPGSPAAKAGLRGGDIILSINNKRIKDNTGIAEVLQSHAPGDVLDILYEREGKKHRTEVELSEVEPEGTNP